MITPFLLELVNSRVLNPPYFTLRIRNPDPLPKIVADPALTFKVDLIDKCFKVKVVDMGLTR